MIDLSPLKSRYTDTPLAVFGLGISGMATIDACINAGFTVYAWDDDDVRRELAAAKGAKIVDLVNTMPDDCGGLVLSPGVPLTHPAPHSVIHAARNKKIEILSDIELLARATPDIPKIAITGTNGKSTTTALIGHILECNGYNVGTGGNLGTPALALPNLGTNGFYVLELSSFQLDLCPDFGADIAILLNITPDHFDRHGDMDGYAAAKKRIFQGGKTAIIGIDDAPCRKIAQDITAEKCITIATAHKGDIYVHENILHDGPVTIDLSHLPTLRGVHNQQNAMAAYAACKTAGLSTEQISEGLKTFPGLPHRQHLVRRLETITFINDSKATNDEAASKALSAYQNIYWIAGGKPKGDTYDECEKYTDRICHAYLIGTAAHQMGSWLAHHKVPHHNSKILHKAIYDAYQQADADIKNGLIDHAVILLSPACASFDQFKSFEQRGQVFTECVDHLPDYLTFEDHQAAGAV